MGYQSRYSNYQDDARKFPIVPHGFEPRSLPPEGNRIGHYPMGLELQDIVLAPYL